MKQNYTVTVKQTCYLTYEVEAESLKAAEETYWEGDRISDKVASDDVISIELKEDN